MRGRYESRVARIRRQVGTMADAEAGGSRHEKKALGPKAEGMKGIAFSVGLRLPPSPVGCTTSARSQPRLLPGSLLLFCDL